MPQLTPLEALQAAVRLAGGVSAVAQDQRVSRTAVHKWLRTGRATPSPSDSAWRMAIGPRPRAAGSVRSGRFRARRAGCEALLK